MNYTESKVKLSQEKFIKKFLNPINQFIFLLVKLPAALFMGVKVIELNHDLAKVTVPYRWSSQNPFRSTYFAAQAAAAEMSTGILCSVHIHDRGSVSMLITDMKAEYTKKVNKKAFFICSMGKEINKVVEQAIQTGEGQQITLEAVGKIKGENGQEEIVSRFWFTWSIKSRKK